MPVLVSIQVGKPKRLGVEGAADPHDRPWVSGFFKEPLTGPVGVHFTNLDGDGQADLVNHGGPDKAVLAYSADHYPAWHGELGSNLPFGAFGENFTVAGLTESDVCIGDVWEVGPVRLAVTQPREPCWKLARRWRRTDLPGRVVATGRSGWYFRVLVEGVIESGFELHLVERPNPQWSVARANRVRYDEKADTDLAAELAAVSGLSGSWRSAFESRAEALRGR